MNKPENPLFGLMIKDIGGPAEVRALKKQMEFVEEINTELADYEKRTESIGRKGIQRRYVFPKTSSPFAAAFDRYLTRKTQQTDPNHVSTLPPQFTNEDWQGLKSAINKYLDQQKQEEELEKLIEPSRQVISDERLGLFVPDQAIPGTERTNKTPSEEIIPSASELTLSSEGRRLSQWEIDSLLGMPVQPQTEPTPQPSSLGDLEEFLIAEGVIGEEGLQELREAREETDRLLREATTRVLKGEVIPPAETPRQPEQPVNPTILDVSPAGKKVPSQWEIDALLEQLQAEEDTRADTAKSHDGEPIEPSQPIELVLPKTIKLTGGFDQINAILAAQNGPEVFVSAKPEDLIAYVKTLTILLEKGATAKMDQLTYTLEPTPSGNNRLTLMGKVAVRKELLFGKSVPAGSVEFKCALVNNLTLSGISLESAPEYQLPIQFKGREGDIERALGNLDGFLFEGINRLVRYPWQATGLRIGESELMVDFTQRT